jgi:2-phospho-L-lactate guanylyltransferase
MTRRAPATAIVPIKPWGLSKSRLAVGAEQRSVLARAFALDVLAAIGQAELVGQIVIVSAETEMRTIARGHGAVVLADRPMLAPDMLNVAIGNGRRWAGTHRPDAPLVVVPADLAALTGPALDAAITAMGHHEIAFVPDMTDIGTTLMWAREPAGLRPSYGPRSAARHAEDGAHEVVDVDDRVRQDVDTTVDLREVRHLGAGAHTTAALARLAPPAGRGARVLSRL